MAVKKNQISFSDRELKELDSEYDGVLVPSLDNPLCSAVAGWKKDRIDEIHTEGLAALDKEMLEYMRDWLDEILGHWPYRSWE